MSVNIPKIGVIIRVTYNFVCFPNNETLNMSKLIILIVFLQHHKYATKKVSLSK